jgi:hypothetical protein
LLAICGTLEVGACEIAQMCRMARNLMPTATRALKDWEEIDFSASTGQRH